MSKSFGEKVNEIVANIPKGKVMTYGAVARRAGNAKAARAVGMYMRTNKDTKKVPCHRVVGSTCSLTGYAFGNGIATKKSMLQKEGVIFKGNNVDLSVSGII